MIIGLALEALRKEYGCRTARGCASLGDTCGRCKYDVDADTVTEALKTILDTFGNGSELPNTSQTKFKPGDKFLLEIGEKRIGLDEYSIVGTDLYVWGSLLEKLTPYESVQVEQKKGHWEIYVISMLDGEGCKCSECGFEGVPYWDYCPNCGARLELVDE